MANKEREAVASILDDLLGNVIASDRRRSGRTRPGESRERTDALESAPAPGSGEEGSALTKDDRDAAAAGEGVPTERSGGAPLTETPPDENYDSMTCHSVITPESAAGTAASDRSTRKSASQKTPAKRAAAEGRNRPALPDTPLSASLPPRGAPLDIPSESELLCARREAARTLARTPTMTVTLRIPQGLNDWLDEYVHGAWPARIRKQELVTEALQLLYAVRGRVGEQVLITEFLPEKEP